VVLVETRGEVVVLEQMVRISRLRRRDEKFGNEFSCHFTEQLCILLLYFIRLRSSL
jgi:hypothetical protein